MGEVCAFLASQKLKFHSKLMTGVLIIAGVSASAYKMVAAERKVTSNILEGNKGEGADTNE